jgi:hypothetical protein
MAEKINELVSVYIKLRERKAVSKKGYDEKMKPLNETMVKIENKLLGMMNDTGTDSFKTPDGTAYKTHRTSARMDDWDSFIAYVIKEEAHELLERRASKAAVEEFKDAHEELPPGISWNEETSVNIRK